MNFNSSRLLLLRFLLLSLLFLMSCSDDEPIIIPEIDTTELTDFQIETIDYFINVALGFEFGGASMITRKWNEDIRISVTGDMPDYLLEELDEIISELNDLMTDGVSISLAEANEPSNFLIFFGSGAAYAAINPGASTFVRNNSGLFFVNWDAQQNLISADMYVCLLYTSDAADE